MTINTEVQYYKDIALRCVPRDDYHRYKAKCFTLNGYSSYSVWIPNKHLDIDGTILCGEDIDYVFKKKRWVCELAGVDMHKFDRVWDMYPRRRRRIADGIDDIDWCVESRFG